MARGINGSLRGRLQEQQTELLSIDLDGNGERAVDRVVTPTALCRGIAAQSRQIQGAGGRGLAATERCCRLQGAVVVVIGRATEGPFVEGALIGLTRAPVVGRFQCTNQT